MEMSFIYVRFLTIFNELPLVGCFAAHHIESNLNLYKCRCLNLSMIKDK